MDGIAVDDLAVLAARCRDQLRQEADRDLLGRRLDAGGGDLGPIDADEFELDRLATGLALTDGRDEPVSDLTR